LSDNPRGANGIPMERKKLNSLRKDYDIYLRKKYKGV